MQKILLLTIFFFYGSQGVISQGSNLDSILTAIVKAKDDSNKVNLFLLAGRAIVYQDANSGLGYYLRGAVLAKKINFVKGAALSYMNLASAYSFISRVDSSLIYMDTAFIYFKELNSADHLAGFFSNRADTYVQISDFKKALLDCDTAMKYAEKTDNKMRLSYIYNVRADIYWYLKQYTLSEEYVDKALEIHKETNNMRMVAQAYADKGDLYAVNKKPEMAISFYKKAIYIGDSLHDESNLSRYHNLLSETYLQINKTNEAAASAIAALDYAKEEDNPVQEAAVYTLLCKIYTLQNNMPAAIKAGRQGHGMAILEVDLPLQQSSAAALAAAFKKAGTLDSAYHYLQISKDLNDSLITKNFNQETANLQISFDVGQKEKQIELLGKDKIIQQQQLKRQQALKIGAMIIALLAVGGTWLAVNRYRLRQQMKELELRNQIAADLHDEVGSSLSSIHMLSQIATKQEGADPKQKDILSKMSTNAKETMEKMGDIVWMIKPGESEGANLKQRMERFAYEICSSKNISVTLGLDDLEKVKLTMEQRKNFYLVFKEALNNAVKYSGTEKIDILVSGQHKQLTLQVIDYGQGFEPETMGRGNGLDNMKNRAQEMSGNLDITSEPGEGTTVQLTVPL